MLDNHETEYWTRAASLVHTDVAGTRDVGDEAHPNVRFYMLNGTPHGSPAATTRRTEVPLGTYQGWNPRCDACGATDFLQPFNVSFWPFAATEGERRAKGDPRPSIELRYPSKADYAAKVAQAAHRLQQQGFILEEDERAVVKNAQKLAWPPVPQDQYPFWKMAE